MQIIFIAIISYLLGSIPFGFLIGKLFKTDITKIGSGNIGATNVVRAAGPLAGVAVFVLDFAKGFLAFYLTQILFGDPIFNAAAGLAVIIGHMYPIFLKFKGGKGIAVSAGVVCAINPLLFFTCIALVVLIAGITRYVSLASLSVSIFATIGMFVTSQPTPIQIIFVIACCLVFIKHQGNIQRLLSGTERKLGQKNV